MSNLINWKSVSDKPKLSCAVIVLFKQYGFNGQRHWSTAFYSHIDNCFILDSNECDGMEGEFYLEKSDLNIPPITEP